MFPIELTLKTNTMKEQQTTFTPLKMNPTSFDAVLNINEIMKGSSFDEYRILLAEPAIDVLHKKQDLNKQEAIILSAIIETSAFGYATCNDIARFFKCPNVQLYIYSPFLDSLIHKGFVRSYDNSRGRIYVVPSIVLDVMSDDKKFVKPVITNLSLTSFLRKYDSLAEERDRQGLEYQLFIEDVMILIHNNLHLPLCRYLEYVFKMGSTFQSMALFILRACSNTLLHLAFAIEKRSGRELYDTEGYGYLMNNIFLFTNKEGENNVFEPTISPMYQLADSQYYSLTSTFCKKYLDGFNIEKQRLKAEVSDGMMSHENIAKKKLFYNQEETSQIGELGKLLKPRIFNRIKRQLKEHGYRQGFAVLFYGDPGTGKTETAMQLARETGRNIIPVDLSQIRDKYIGESEKRTKAIFDDYREAMKRSKLAPILLLNEADGLLSKRLSSIDHSADQMENTMQNILLQEMETFEGIMIATTNLTCNLDSAFDRRFLYKVEFHKPSAEVRQSIWKSMIRDLSTQDAMTMAKEFDYTGGEIENIARKYVVSNILHNTRTDIGSLRAICKNEKMSRGDNRKRIGF